MSKTILVSNRLSTSVTVENGSPTFSASIGGLATGLSSFHERDSSLWVGWSGVPCDTVPAELNTQINETLRKEHKSVAVDISSEELSLFYSNFCNDIIWPLFHYFPTYVHYDNDAWESYKSVNEKFFRVVAEVAEPDDIIWVHDYQLMLLPFLVKQHLPDARVGFFLHIPFPSYEIFRLLPWRQEILNGLVGADLIGFHTYDYARHFLSSVRRLLGYENSMANIELTNRTVKVDVFPMGIDYARYNTAADLPDVSEEIAWLGQWLGDKKVILSVDRLDYTKGIPQRLRAFKRFLELYPEYHEKVTLVMIVAPSRVGVPRYMMLKREIDELVGVINGAHATIAWTPISYFFRSFPFGKLTALYNRSDVLLVTPLRDGMNLITKEYVAARRDKKGVVVLSETTGAARELSEALIVNSVNTDEIAETIRQALDMPTTEQIKRNTAMHARIKRYDLQYWAHDFMDKLDQTKRSHEKLAVRRITANVRSEIIDAYTAAKRRLLLLDYDGTLRGFVDRPADAQPDDSLKELLVALAGKNRNELVVISGRSREVLDTWLGDLPIGIVAGHGVWLREPGREWHMIEHITSEWQDVIYPVLQLYADRTPGSSIEKKDYSLAWHYRLAEPELAAVRVSELRDALLSFTMNLDLSILEGNNVIEVRNSGINKGRAAGHWAAREDWDFIMAIGDDHTDEDMFHALPEDSITIKVGMGISAARFFLNSTEEVRALLEEMRALA